MVFSPSPWTARMHGISNESPDQIPIEACIAKSISALSRYVILHSIYIVLLYLAWINNFKDRIKLTVGTLSNFVQVKMYITREIHVLETITFQYPLFWKKFCNTRLVWWYVFGQWNGLKENILGSLFILKTKNC